MDSYDIAWAIVGPSLGMAWLLGWAGSFAAERFAQGFLILFAPGIWAVGHIMGWW